MDPATVLAALAATTSHVGLVATASTTYNEPYNLARRFASLDHLSRGRAGWNIVTTFVPDVAANFGSEALPRGDERYDRAEEFVDVVRSLWEAGNRVRWSATRRRARSPTAAACMRSIITAVTLMSGAH